MALKETIESLRQLGISDQLMSMWLHKAYTAYRKRKAKGGTGGVSKLTEANRRLKSLDAREQRHLLATLSAHLKASPKVVK